MIDFVGEHGSTSMGLDMTAGGGYYYIVGYGEENGVPYLERKVFLDNIVKSQEISQKIEEAIGYARRDGHAVAIGHPYPETLSLLSEKLPEIERNGVDLVWASEALEEKL